jgi:hypothetical protein
MYSYIPLEWWTGHRSYLSCIPSLLLESFYRSSFRQLVVASVLERSINSDKWAFMSQTNLFSVEMLTAISITNRRVRGSAVSRLRKSLQGLRGQPMAADWPTTAGQPTIASGSTLRRCTQGEGEPGSCAGVVIGRFGCSPFDFVPLRPASWENAHTTRESHAGHGVSKSFELFRNQQQNIR